MENLTRRDFIGAISALAAAPGLANSITGEPILDFHQHTNYAHRTDEQLIAHQVYHSVNKTVLLPGEGWMLSELGDNASCAALEAEAPTFFMRFACSDVAESRTEDVLRGNVARGAKGIGELKFHVAVDSPEMHRVYKLAGGLDGFVRLIQVEANLSATFVAPGFGRSERYLCVDLLGSLLEHSHTLISKA
ncbi:MAG: hypothetical protein ABSF71_37340 [Terriglobia bacterium]|jgi:hypothetical protein